MSSPARLHFTYKADIWLEDMHFGLTWSYSEHCIKPDSYRAPSWSWAAMDCFRTGNSFSVYGHAFATDLGPKTFSKAKVLNCVVTLKDNDPTVLFLWRAHSQDLLDQLG